ncbi:FAR1-related protein [Striga asiatica]|uniref:FAR1-related protein n=1 Tax=Striga asiatica TaxID=4170 RepID=A0A5A7P6P6_STRAF|nr:FAR1-related protein [Striga asiatica]
MEIVTVLRNEEEFRNLESIPEKCIVSRWTKHASLKPIFVVDGEKEMIVSVQGKQSDPGMKKCLFEKYYGDPLPSEVEVLPPTPMKNKDSGSRLKSGKEKAVERSKKFCLSAFRFLTQMR